MSEQNKITNIKIKLQTVIEHFCIEQNLKNEFDGVSDFKDAIDRAVDKAYRDASRPLKGIGKSEDQQNKKHAALDGIKGEIKDYFTNNICFKEVHGKCCNAWTGSELDEKYKQFGTAQKIVNMSFKYLYCWVYITNKDEYLEKFDDCHMPIDFYTLSWLIEQDEKHGKKYLQGINRDTSWTRLTVDNYNRILDLTNYLKYNSSYWKENGAIEGLSILESEFVIWEYQKIKSIITPVLKLFEKNSYKNMGLDGISESVNNLKNNFDKFSLVSILNK